MRPGSIMRKHIIAPALAKRDPRGLRVLDLGGFDGSMTAHLAADGAHVTVLDLDAVGIEQAKARGLDGVVGSADRIPFPDATFDLVVCCDLLQSVPHDVEEPIFREVARVLKRDGALVLTVPDLSLHLPFVALDKMHASWHSREGLTADRLRELAARAGIEIVEQRDYFGLISRLYYAMVFFKNLPPRGTRIKRKLFKQLIAAEQLWCPRPQAHLIVARPRP